MKKTFTGLLLFQIFATLVFAQEWTVPADKRGRLSPFPFNDSIRKAGLQLYNLNCQSCHGTPGKGNFQALVPPPGDPATDKIQHNTDGEIFYKISEGRGQMPSFKNTLSSREIWNIVSCIRSFNKAYIQSVMPEITAGAYSGALISISMILHPIRDSVTLRAAAIRGSSVVPITGAGVRIFVKRTFGFLPLDDEKATDNQGIAVFAIPKGLPGDTAGKIQVSARFTDEEQFGSISKDTLLEAGVKTRPISLVRDRAMWNTVRKAPWWILLTYSLGVLMVWGFIIIALLKLRDIYIIGEHLGSDTDFKE